MNPIKILFILFSLFTFHFSLFARDALPNKEINQLEWYIYLGIVIFLLWYLKDYMNLIVIKLIKNPKKLLTLTPIDLKKAKQKLKKINRYETTLKLAKTTNEKVENALKFYENPTVESLTEHLKITYTQNAEFHKLKIPNLGLNIENFLLIITNQNAESIKEQYLTRDKIFIITTEEYQDGMAELAREKKNNLISPNSAELTEMFLSQKPKEVLVRVLAQCLSFKYLSPYKTRGGIKNGDNFFGRIEIINEMTTREGRNYLLVGSRAVGKTSVLEALRRYYANSSTVECYYFNLEEGSIIRDMNKALNLDKNSSLERVVKEIESREKKVIFLIDEADKFVKSPENEKISSTFRKLSQENHALFVLAGFWRLYESVTMDYYSPLKNFGEIINLNTLEKEACIELMIRPMRRIEVEYEDVSLVDEVVKKCGSRANLIVMVCDNIIKNLENKTITKEDIAQAMEQENIYETLMEWEGLSSGRENSINRLIVYLTFEMNRFSFIDVMNRIEEEGLNIEVEEVKRSLRQLTLGSVFQKRGMRKKIYIYSIPLLKKIFLENKKQVKKQLANLIASEHPLVLQLTNFPKELLNLNLQQLIEAKAKLKQINQWKAILELAKTTNKKVENTLTFYQNPQENMELFIKLIGAKYYQQEGAFFRLTLADEFKLRVNNLLLYFASDDAEETLAKVLLHNEIVWVIVTEESEQKLVDKAKDRTNNLVATTQAKLTELLLGRESQEVLAEILAKNLSFKLLSPYPTESGVAKESSFFGRSEIIRDILSQNNANYFLVGARLLGKTAILQALQRRYANDEKAECFYVTLQADDTLAKSLAEVLQMSNPTEVTLDELVVEIGSRKRKAIFLIDEVDKMIANDQNDEITSFFRKLSQEGKATFVLTGFWTFYYNMTSEHESPLLNFGKLIILDGLEHEACRELLVEPMKSMGLSYENDEVVEQLIVRCGRRANLLATTCSKIIGALGEEQRIITQEMVETVVKQTGLDEYKLSTWGRIGGKGDKVSNALDRLIVYLTLKEEQFTFEEIVEQLEEIKPDIEIENITKSLKRLVIGYVLSEEEGVYKRRIPLLKEKILSGLETHIKGEIKVLVKSGV